MSPADYLELSQLGTDGVAVHAMNAVSILTAYLVAMYFGGKVLTKFQLASVTTIYSLFLLFPVLGALGGFGNLITLNMEFLREYPDVAATYRASDSMALFQIMRIIMMSVFFFAWLLSIAFMFSIRKGSKNVPHAT